MPPTSKPSNINSQQVKFKADSESMSRQQIEEYNVLSADKQKDIALEIQHSYALIFQSFYNSKNTTIQSIYQIWNKNTQDHLKTKKNDQKESKLELYIQVQQNAQSSEESWEEYFKYVYNNTERKEITNHIKRIEQQLESEIDIKSEIKKIRQHTELLITSNLRLVRFFASKYIQETHQLKYMDLFQAGIIGLMISIEKYEPERGINLSTFAGTGIRRAIINEISTKGYELKGTHRHRYWAYKVQELTKEHEQQGKPLTNKELKKELGLSLKFIAEIKQYYPSTIQLQEPIGENITLEDTLTTTLENPTTNIEQAKLHEILTSALESLNDRAKDIIYQRFGLTPDPSELRSDHTITSLQTIANSYGIGRERTRQIEMQALRNLRKILEEQKPELLLYLRS